MITANNVHWMDENIWSGCTNAAHRSESWRTAGLSESLSVDLSGGLSAILSAGLSVGPISRCISRSVSRSVSRSWWDAAAVDSSLMNSLSIRSGRCHLVLAGASRISRYWSWPLSWFICLSKTFDFPVFSEQTRNLPVNRMLHSWETWKVLTHLFACLSASHSLKDPLTSCRFGTYLWLNHLHSKLPHPLLCAQPPPGTLQELNHLQVLDFNFTFIRYLPVNLPFQIRIPKAPSL